MSSENIQTAPDYRKARAKALEVLRVNHVVKPPVVPREIAEAYGLSVEVIDLPDDMKRVAGFIDFDADRIFVSSSDHYNRQTFTIAHELGHYLINKTLYTKQPQN